ncbi:MAG TPA: ribonuclease J [Candidatus Saccharimonadales bacterium]|nr:ribonuclease J [Candidatus Saccharimonadales bacterium]
MNQYNKPRRTSGTTVTSSMVSAKTRGEAIRAQRRNQDDADKVIGQYADASQTTRGRANVITDDAEKLKVTFLGGLEDVGEKNMAVIEYGGQAIILDCGNNLSIDLPGVNYAINDTAYLETIRDRIRAYAITHGHLDHMGGLKHIVPKYPAPIYGSRFTIGVIEKSFSDDEPKDSANFTPELVIANLDSHEQLTVGAFGLEFIRITHSIPDAAAVCIATPVGRIIATGDFRLDPEPLDRMPSDVARLKELGDQGVLLLLSESSYVDIPGRVPTESTLQQSFYDIIDQAEGRIFVAAFSSNMNRAQMIINAAVAAGRNVVLDGRGMLSYAEIAVRQGVLKVPKGTIIPITQAATVADSKLLIICTGGQGEPNAALQRMSDGEHKSITLHAGDTVVVSSSPIPGNEVRYDLIGNKLSRLGVHLFRHPTHELDGCGPLHVSGHARRDELREMIQLVRPKFFIPVHGGPLRRKYHAELGVQEHIPRKSVLLPENGDSLYFTADTVEQGGQVPHGSLLVDQTGSIVSGLVVKDRLMLSEAGIVTAILTVDKKSGQLLTSPDIISRGFIAMRDSEDLMRSFRAELRRAVQQRFLRIGLDQFKVEMRDFITHFLYDQTGHSPIVIPVVNVVAGNVGAQTVRSSEQPRAEVKARADQKRFQEMRARLLGQDQRD